MIWSRLAGVSGASAVILGAVGAHALPKDRSDQMREVFKTGCQYHLIHSAVLAACAMSLPKGRKRNIVCGLFATGILLFSGSCYIVCAVNQRKPYSYPAPVGGMALIGGWLALGLLP
jgi:uncharacterized membrane protein YgdD (TMEM256/DUF423 family)